MVLSSNTFLTKAVRSARFFFAGFLRLFLSRCPNRLCHIFAFPSLAKINLIVDYVCRTPGIVQIAYTGGRSNNFVVLVQDFTPEWLNLVDFPPSDAFDTLKRLWESFGTYSMSYSLHFSVFPSSKSILIITGPSAVASRMCPSPSVISCGLGKGCSLLLLHMHQVAPQSTIQLSLDVAERAWPTTMASSSVQLDSCSFTATLFVECFNFISSLPWRWDAASFKLLRYNSGTPAAVSFGSRRLKDSLRLKGFPCSSWLGMLSYQNGHLQLPFPLTSIPRVEVVRWQFLS